MLQVLIVLQVLLAAVRVNLIAFASAATLATGIRIQSSVHASAEHGRAFYGGWACGCLLASVLRR